MAILQYCNVSRTFSKTERIMIMYRSNWFRKEDARFDRTFNPFEVELTFFNKRNKPHELVCNYHGFSSTRAPPKTQIAPLLVTPFLNMP